MASVMSRDHNVDPAIERVIAGIDDEELAARYPDRAHFISADNPNQSEMATRALFNGDPVVIVYPDGHELLVRPERAARLMTALLAMAALYWKLRRFNRGDSFQLPPRIRIEARDSSGHQIAA